jgi:alpha-tubulin suppressor-like RCC1 family protein
VAAGWDHAAGLKLDGTVTAWGVNDYGQATVPDGLSGVVAIDCGSASTYALKSDGTVVAWGYDDGGRTSIHPDIRGVTAIAAGNAHAILLKKAP